MKTIQLGKSRVEILDSPDGGYLGQVLFSGGKRVQASQRTETMVAAFEAGLSLFSASQWELDVQQSFQTLKQRAMLTLLLIYVLLASRLRNKQVEKLNPDDEEWDIWAYLWTLEGVPHHPGILGNYEVLDFLEVLGYLIPTSVNVSKGRSRWGKITLTPSGENAASHFYSAFAELQLDLLPFNVQ